MVGAGPLGRAVEVVKNSAAALSEGVELDAFRQGVADPEPFHARPQELLDVDGLIKIVADNVVAAGLKSDGADHVVSPFDETFYQRTTSIININVISRSE